MLEVEDTVAPDEPDGARTRLLACEIPLAAVYLRGNLMRLASRCDACERLADDNVGELTSVEAKELISELRAIARAVDQGVRVLDAVVDEIATRLRSKPPTPRVTYTARNEDLHLAHRGRPGGTEDAPSG